MQSVTAEWEYASKRRSSDIDLPRDVAVDFPVNVHSIN